jgi:hypothetical protein
MEEIIENKCERCGKIFRDDHDYKRHLNRKKQCSPRNGPEENRFNPLQCIYCKKVLSTKANLKRHYNICTDEQKKGDNAMEKMMEMMLEMREKMEKLQAKTKVINNNNVVIGQLNVVVNNYNNPNYQHLLEFDRFKKMISEEMLRYPIAVALELYFDPTHPENSSIHLVDKETKKVLVRMNDGWATMPMETVVSEIRNIGYKIAAEIVRHNGIYTDSEERKEFTMSKKDIIAKFRPMKDSIDYERQDRKEIEERIEKEYANSSTHPAVIEENFKRAQCMKELKQKYKN